MTGNMIYNREKLEERLEQLSKTELIDLVKKLYFYTPDSHSLINKAVVTREPAEDVLSHMQNYTPGECKTALAAYVKTIKDKKERVLYYYEFIEWILNRKDTLDFRFISVASATYGKAMEILEKNRPLWDELLDKSYEIAGRFNELDGAAAYKAVEYYVRVKRGFDREAHTR